MSNDVHSIHIAKVSKIQRSADIMKGSVGGGGGGDLVSPRSRGGRMSKGKGAAEDECGFLCGSIGGVQQAGEVDSPDHTQRDTNESDNNISSCSTLDIVNKVEHLSLHQLETQLRELSQRLQQSEDQRADLQRQLKECAAEKDLCCRRLEIVGAAHECRITEMHCVIAELSKKLRTKQECTILEEQEPEGSDISYQEGSIYNSELNLTNPDAECQTDPLDGIDHSTSEGFGNGDDDNRCTNATDELKLHDNISRAQVEALQEEVLHLKAQIALLQSELSSAMRAGQECVTIEEQQSVELFGEDVEANESNCSLEQLRFVHKDDQKLNNLDVTHREKNFVAHCEQITSPQKDTPVAKMAERVKLRCASKVPKDLNLKNANIVEHLVADLRHNHGMSDSFTESSHYDDELQRLQRKVDSLKVQTAVLSLTLDESKGHAEHLYLLCGKYESNAIALQSALNCSDRAIEAYDVMLALLESKLALIKDQTAATEESRKAVESVARHLLDRLESEKNVFENSLGPWQNTFSIPEKACAPWTTEDDTRLRCHVSKLKGRRSTVQNTLVNLESPFREKARPPSDDAKDPNSRPHGGQLDLEMAVLLQELLNLREENLQLKIKVEQADKERQFSADRTHILQEALQQLQLQLATDSQALFRQPHMENSDATTHRVSYSEAEHAALTEQHLVEALTRESELKGRLQTLIASVAESQKLSDEKCAQLHENVRELQKSNLSLAQVLEQNKRKYQLRIRKLEQRVMEMSLELSGGNGGQLQQLLKCKNAGLAKPLQTRQCDNVPETTL